MRPMAERSNHNPRDNMNRDNRNVFATMALFAGIASWVPLVIVVAFPLTIVAALVAVVTATRGSQRRGLNAAGVGVLLALSAAVVHLSVAGLGAFIGSCSS